MRVPNIICFAKDWGENPTSNHHVMRELAKTHRVLWLNSVGTRTPNLGSSRDVGKIFRKLASFAQGPEQIDDNLWVFTPLVLPLPHNPHARRLNRLVLRATLRALRLRLGMREFQLWTFLPNVADYVGALGEELAVYYVVDDWSGFNYVDGKAILAAEKTLVERVDLVFAVSEPILASKRAINPATHYAPHGVDHAAFARALDDATEIPADVASLPRPIVGFYGTLQDWVDYDLIALMAERHPDWSIVLVGDVHTDLSRFDSVANVHLVGRKRHEELPAYCKAFDVGIIPYLLDERMRSVNPLKLREYLSAGLPVVSTRIPACEPYADRCALVDDHDAFDAAVVAALAADTPAARRERSEAMKSETWGARVKAVLAEVDAALAR